MVVIVALAGCALIRVSKLSHKLNVLIPHPPTQDLLPRQLNTGLSTHKPQRYKLGSVTADSNAKITAIIHEPSTHKG